MRGLIANPARTVYVFFREDVFVLPSRTLVLVFCILLLALPPFLPLFWVRILTQACLFAIFAASWDLVAGFTGQVNFGHALFFGVGAYTSSLLNYHLGITPWLTVPAGAVAATVVGAGTGAICLRLRGSYLSLATLSFPIILLGLLFAFPDLSGGELGISGLKPLFRSRIGIYYLSAVVMLASVFLMWKITDSSFGLILHAIREDEVAARASGINTPRYKILAFALSALFAGLAGAFFAHFLRIAGPSSLEVALSFLAVIWGIFGGIVTIWGPVVGVFSLTIFTDIIVPEIDLELWGKSFQDIRLLLFAVVVLLVLLFMPEGIAPWVRNKIETVCARCKNRNVATRRLCRICNAEL